MTRPVIAQDLQSLLKDKDEALARLEAIGVQARSTRFGEYQRNLATVLKHRNAGTLEKLPKIVSTEQYLAFIESVRGPRFKEKVYRAAAGSARFSAVYASATQHLKSCRPGVSTWNRSKHGFHI